MHPTTCLMHTNATSNFPEETPARPLGRHRFLTTLGAITSVFALGMAPLMANPADDFSIHHEN
jgi:hypothetical protein